MLGTVCGCSVIRRVRRVSSLSSPLHINDRAPACQRQFLHIRPHKQELTRRILWLCSESSLWTLPRHYGWRQNGILASKRWCLHWSRLPASGATRMAVTATPSEHSRQAGWQSTRTQHRWQCTTCRISSESLFTFSLTFRLTSYSLLFISLPHDIDIQS